MSLLALLLALACERGLTHLFHLREPRWLDRYCDWASRVFGREGGATVPGALVAVALPVVPVAAIDWMLGSHLLGLPQLGLAVLVLLVTLLLNETVSWMRAQSGTTTACGPALRGCRALASCCSLMVWAACQSSPAAWARATYLATTPLESFKVVAICACESACHFRRRMS